MTHKIETPDKDGNGCSLDCGVAFVHTHPDGNVKHPVAVEEPTSVDNDFEFFNLNPNPTQIRGYMTGVRNKAREEETERVMEWVNKNTEWYYKGMMRAKVSCEYNECLEDLTKFLSDNH